MSGEILLINPRKKSRRKTTRKTASKKRRVKRKSSTTRRSTTRRRSTKSAAPARGVRTMAKRRKRAITKRATSNPRRRSYAKAKSYGKKAVRSAGRRAKASFLGINFKSAFKDIPFYQAGMFGSKWLAKRFGGGASQLDPESWTWSSYLKGGLGAVGMGFILGMVRPSWGQKALEGGLNLMVYEMIQNEFIQGNEWAKGQFGEDEVYDDLEGYGYDYGYQPGDIEQDETGKSYLLGQDYQWQALPETTQGVLEPVGPLGQLEPVGPLGEVDPYRSAILG